MEKPEILMPQPTIPKIHTSKPVAMTKPISKSPMPEIVVSKSTTSNMAVTKAPISEPSTLKVATQKPSEQKPLMPQPSVLTFADVISNILSRQGQAVVNSETATQILNFLKANKIGDYKELEKHLQKLMGRQRNLSKEFTPIREKLERVAAHMNQYETYKVRKAAYEKYQADYNAQRPWKKKAFAESNSVIVENYNVSKEYIDALRNDKNKVPINAWKKEHEQLVADIKKLNGEYKSLENEVAQVDKIRINVYDILRKEKQREQLKKEKVIEF